MDKYKDWSKEELIAHIQTLENKITNEKSIPTVTTTTVTSKENKDHKKTKKQKKQERPFDITKYRQRRIALKVAYLGWKYIGFAAQQDEINVPTVEGQLFQALEHCKLISHRDQCDYSRCGRTDRGVSGLGQVIILNVRSKQLALHPKDEDEEGKEDNKEEIPYLSIDEEIPYVDNLNRSLPDDIRILAWSPVPSHLNARFDCKSRTYRYLFRQEELDLSLMQEAASYFIGEHDFRNFCKLDPSKNITNYHRRMLSCTITPLQSSSTYSESPSLSSSDDKKNRMVQFELRGTAFLWHQVRCMMSILFLVGQKLEKPTIVKDLLTISKYDARPDYPMASDLPLILYDCEFDPESIQWHYSSVATERVVTHWNQFSYAQDIRSWTCHYFYEAIHQHYHPLVLSQQEQQKENEEEEDHPKKKKKISSHTKMIITLGGGSTSLLNHYKPLEERPRCHTDEMMKDRYNAKKRKREQLEKDS
ncbi:unnamed protein product [Cunninghamella blakesleeana]